MSEELQAVPVGVNAGGIPGVMAVPPQPVLPASSVVSDSSVTPQPLVPVHMVSGMDQQNLPPTNTCDQQQNTTTPHNTEDESHRLLHDAFHGV